MNALGIVNVKFLGYFEILGRIFIVFDNSKFRKIYNRNFFGGVNLFFFWNLLFLHRNFFGRL